MFNLKINIMGFFSEIKRLLFVKKSVAKSAAEKSGDYIKEKAEDIAESSKEFVKDTGETISHKTSGLRDAVMEKSKDWMDKGKDMAEDLGDKGKELFEDISEKGKELYEDISESEPVKKMADFTEDVGEKVMDAGEKVMDKFKSTSEDMGESAFDLGDKLSEKGKDWSEKIGEKVLDVKDDLVEKAKDVAGDLSEKLDATIEKAEEFEAEEAAKPKKEFSEETLDTGESLLTGSDDFFEKAAKFADGDYEAITEGTTTILDEKVEETKKEISKAAGFEDLDGDGNEIIDDAVIVDYEEE